MASVDDRVVAMKFDNAAFESKIAATMGSLEKLKGHLNFSDAKSSLADITSASNAFNLNGIAAATESIAGKFSVMGVAAFTVIQNLVTRAMTAGEQIAKSLTIAPISSGFSNYETKMTAIQTVMAGTGESMQRVNDKLAELNAYSDKTVYHFKDMTDNIGKFTNAGVSLDDAVQSIQGIANVAAISGANTENASAAMYNFGQSLSQGSVKLMDWKSIENANMGTVGFKTHLMDSAVAVGTLTKSADGLYKTLDGAEVTTTNFNTTLEKQWLTSEALTGTLKEYADTTTEIGKQANDAATQVKTFSQMMDGLKDAAATGWSKTSELLFGNLEEAKYLWTGVNNVIGGVIGSAANARNKLLGDFNALGGHNVVVETLFNLFTALGNVLKPIHDAFREIFPAKTGQQLFDFAVRLRTFVQSLIATPAVMENIKSVFKGVFAILSIGISIVKGIFHLFTGLLGLFINFSGGGILEFFAGLGDKIFAFQQLLANGNVISGFFDTITNAVGSVVSKIGPAFDFLKGIFIELLTYFRMGINGFDLSGRLSGIQGFANGVGIAFGKIKDIIVEIAGYFSDGFTDIGTNEGSGIFLFANRVGMALKSIKDMFTGVDFSSGFIDGIHNGFTAAIDKLKNDIIPGLKKIVASVLAFFGISSPSTVFFDIGNNLIIGLGNGIKAAFKFLGDAFSSIFGFLGDILSSGNFDSILKLVNSGLFAGFLVILNKFSAPFTGLGKIFDSVNKNIKEITGVFEAMQTKLKAEALLKIAIAMGVLAVAMVVIASIDAASLGKALGAMAIGFGQLAVMMKILDKMVTGPKDAAKIALLAAGLILIAGAISVLAIACKIFALLSPEDMLKGIGSVTFVLVSLAAISKPMSANSDGMIKAGIGIMAISTAILVLGLAVKLFSMMDPAKMAQGLIAVSVLLAGLAISVEYFSKNSEGMIKAGAGIWLIAHALGALVGPVEDFGKMDTKVLIQGMIAVAAALVILVAAIKGMPEDAATKGAGILLLAIALNILAMAVERLGNMDMLVLIKGLGAVAAALIIINIAMDSMPKGDELAKQGLGLLLLSIALIAIASVVKLFGNMSLGELIKGVGGLGVIMFGLAAAMKMMPDGKSLALKGAGLLAVGAALVLLVGAVKAMAALSLGDLIKGLVGLAAIFLIIGVAGHFLEPVIPALLGFGIALVLVGAGMALIGLGAKLLAQAFGILVKILVDNINNMAQILDFFIQNLTKLLVAIAKAIIEVVKIVIAALPEIIGSLDKVIIAILDLIIRSIPKLAEVFMTFISTILTVITTMVPQIIAAGLTLILALLQGIADNIGGIVTIVAEIIINFLDALTAQLPGIIASGVALLVALLQGIADNIGLVVAAAINIVTSLIAAIAGAQVDLIKAGFDAIIHVIEGIGGAAIELVAAIAKFIVDFISALGDGAADIIAAGTTAILQVIEGLGKGATELATAVAAFIVDFITALGNGAADILVAGTDLIVKVIEGIGAAASRVSTAAADTIVAFLGGLDDNIQKVIDAGFDFVIQFLNGLSDSIDKHVPELQAAGKKLAGSILDGVTFGMAGKVGDAVHAAGNIAGSVITKVGDTWQIGSPSKVFMKLAGAVGEGIALGLDNDKTAVKGALNLGGRVITTMQNSLSLIPDALSGMDEFSPTITPVLDLTNVRNGAQGLSNLLGLSAGASFDVARSISASSNGRQEELLIGNDSTGSKVVKFEQNNYSPEALSTADIYRKTRNQLAMAKEELGVL